MRRKEHVKLATERIITILYGHAEHFTELYEEINENALDEAYIASCENKYNIFRDIDYSVYGT